MSFQSDIYAKTMRGIARLAWRGDTDMSEFRILIWQTVETGLARAWHTALVSEGIDPKTEASDVEKAVLKDAYDFAWDALQGYADFIFTHRKEDGFKYRQILYRVKIWANRYTAIYKQTKMLASGNKKLMWVWNPEKEHCFDCANLNGRVYRAHTWKKWDIYPQSTDLECGGWYCGCTLKATDEKCTPGRPPMIKGQKELSVIEKGGPGSGHFGHAGRPEKVGGSLPGSRAFRAWFGNSKVVDKDDKPLVVYHATVHDFEIFDIDKVGSTTDPGAYGSGFYFAPYEFVTPYIQVNSWMHGEDSYDANANIIPVYLNMRNPLNIRNRAELLDLMGIDYSGPNNNGMFTIKGLRATADLIPKWITDNGYDGIIVQVRNNSGEYFGVREYIVFGNTQIKSIYNQGDFDPDDPNILKSDLIK